MPASAVLSGVLVKAGVIGLIRFLPFDAPLPAWGTVLATAGILTAFGGAALGVAQQRPKTILAYSTVSQMGLVAAILVAGLGRRRCRRAGSGGLLRRASHAGERWAVPRRRHRLRNRRSAPASRAAAGTGLLALSLAACL